MKCPRCKMLHNWCWSREGKVGGPGEWDEGECDDDDGEPRRLEKVETDAFHINLVDDKYRCNGCGGDRFVVGNGPYRTVIKCPKCGWEATVHDG